MGAVVDGASLPLLLLSSEQCLSPQTFKFSLQNQNLSLKTSFLCKNFKKEKCKFLIIYAAVFLDMTTDDFYRWIWPKLGNTKSNNSFTFLILIVIVIPSMWFHHLPIYWQRWPVSKHDRTIYSLCKFCHSCVLLSL